MQQPEARDRETTVQEVLAEYAKLTKKHEGYSATRPAWDAASAFLRWCKQHDVEQPLLFVWLRFRVLRSGMRSRTVHPSLQNMASEALLPRYRALIERQRTEREMKQGFATQRERELVAVNAGHEAMRRDYLVMGKSELCEALIEETGGYHPYSAWCPGCPRAITCSSALNAQEGFDVVALRLGRLTPEEASEAKKRRGIG